MIASIMKLILLIVNTWLEKDKDRKIKKQKIIKEAKDAIQSKDPTAVTAAFDRLNQ